MVPVSPESAATDFTPQKEEAESILGWITTDWRSIIMAAAIAAEAAIFFLSLSTPLLHFAVTGGLFLGTYYAKRTGDLRLIQGAIARLDATLSKITDLLEKKRIN